MEYKDRIKVARKRAGLTQLQLAIAVGLNQTSISDLERGKSSASSFSYQIASACGVSPDWLIFGLGTMLAEPDDARPNESTAPLPGLASEDTVAIRRLDVRAPMERGELQNPPPDTIEVIHMSRRWLRQSVNVSNIDNLVLITAFGDSMEGTFNDGDVLLVDRGVTCVKLDAIYLLGLKDEVFIKRLQRRPDGSLLMISDNKNYENYTITSDEMEQFSVTGRVLLAWNARKL